MSTDPSAPVTLKLVSCDGGYISIVTLNRPRVKNAMNKALCQKLASVLDGLRCRSDVRAVVLTGAGHCFSAGVDLKDPIFSDLSLVSREAMSGPKHFLWQLQQLTVPSIAAISGPCVTGGMEIALNCDVLLCDETAVFRDTHALYGATTIPSSTCRHRVPTRRRVADAHQASTICPHGFHPYTLRIVTRWGCIGAASVAHTQVHAPHAPACTSVQASFQPVA
jgi:enoyl-CoA hydratase/carnithine racemase